MTAEKQLKIFTLIFIIFNILGTFFITLETLNNFVIVFSYTSFTIISSLLGNLIIVSLITMIIFLFAKKAYSRMISMTVVSFFLGIAGLLLWTFMRYYQSPFLSRDLSFSKNAVPEMAFSFVGVIFYDLISHYRIVFFIGFLVLLTLTIVFMSRRKKLFYGGKRNPKVLVQSPVKIMTAIILLVLLSFGHINLGYSYTKEGWKLDHERPLYGIQTVGLYNFYFYDLMGFNWANNKDTANVTISDLSKYDKNVSEYVTIFNEIYSNKLDINQASTVSIDPSLGQVSYLNGIFEGKNIVYIQLESFNTFLVDGSSPKLANSNLLNNFYRLVEQSYYFENFYNTVGIGNTSDAELSSLTGLYPNGNHLFYWQYGNEEYPRDKTLFDKAFKNPYSEMIDYELNPLSESLGDDYYSASFHADTSLFYNRENVHPGMLKFDDFYHYTVKEIPPKKGNVNVIDAFPDHLETLPDSPWVGEKDLFEWVKIVAKEKQDADENYFLYPITIHAHTPFEYDPYIDEPTFTKDDFEISTVALNYLNYLKYYNDIFQMIIDMASELTNTIYVIYGDHGVGFSPKELEEILERPDLTNLEAWEILNRVPALIYAPNDNNFNGDIKTGLITGKQPLVRSQIDLYRTTLELVGKNEGSFYYGVNGLSDEKTFAILTRISLLVTDDFTMQLKKYVPSKKLDEHSILYHNDFDYDLDEVINKIIDFKYINDLILETNLLQEINTRKKRTPN